MQVALCFPSSDPDSVQTQQQLFFFLRLVEM